MPDTPENTNEQNTGLLQAVRDEVHGIFRAFLSVTSPGSNAPTLIPYYGSDVSLYAVEKTSGEYSFPSHPIAEYDGRITKDSLQYAFDSVTQDTMLERSEKLNAYRRILASHHALMFDNPTLETALETQIETLRQPEAVLQEAGESLSDNATIYEFAYTAESSVELAVDQTNDTAPALIYRNILRTGKWSVSPNSSADPLVISKKMLDDIVAGFQDGAFEYVTVPETHLDLPSENRGFIRDVTIIEDPNRVGEYILRGGFEFTNDNARNAVLEGSIAGVSCGIVFQHKRKSDGKLYDSALHHVALTNKPWIDGLGGWETIAASEFGAEIVVGLEQADNLSQTQEITTMPDENTTTGVSLSQEQIDALIADNRRLKLAQARNDVADFLRPYQTEKKLTPAVLTAAEKLLFAAKVSPKMMSLSQDNTEVEIDLSQTVKEMLDAMPEGANLSEPPVDTTSQQQQPPLETTTVSSEERVKQVRELTGFKSIDNK